MNKSYKPKDTPSLIPYLVVKSVEETSAFYQKAFQFKLGVEKEHEGHLVHAEFTFDEALIMLGREGAYGQDKTALKNPNERPAIGLYLYVPDVDSYYQHAVKNGAKSLQEPEDMFWGDRMCRLKDPDGFEWSFGTYLNKAD